MGRRRLDTISAFARYGYWMRFTCDGCAHGVERDPITLMIDLQARGSIPSIDTLERRMRCSVCGRRGATITACEPSD